ncbi:PAS domain S-box-containing protein/diguanylate cyclase (GGDEF) domain-containing protein [Caloramator fervidus]|uniref:PAS domain S-box-containing protein/diguanylate cyclase (GGDEF) domain-containing protein n=1 Tax=Caloramator fervidus TaxID=29344 RepID=A0A1H5TMV8_9CLOT|nr:diguanylate cyclase [Caloramator fervidus]SEF64110.1 PAS domain S-box-containing protein/diguanylate cyclase (GGDEF) domain-containing protein [Caloramator fervidus]
MKDIKFIIDNMKNPFVYGNIILDENKNPTNILILEVNKAFEELVGLKKEDILNKSIKDILSNFDFLNDEYCFLGKYYSIDICFDKEGVALIFNDITRYKKLYLKSKEKENIIKQVTENLEEAIILQDVKTKEIIYISPSFSKIHGILIEEVLKNKHLWKISVHPKDLKRIEKEFTMDYALKKIKEEGFFQSVYRILNSDGSYKWILSKYIPIKNEKGEIIRVLGIDQDITRLKNVEEKLKKEKQKAQKMAMIDYLTKIYNRRAFFIRAKEEIKKFKDISIIMADIDRFKNINDTFGHDIGDEVLKHFAKILKFHTKQGFAARFGGEEFIILLHENGNKAYDKAEAIRKYIEESKLSINGNVIRYTASFGVSSLREQDNLDIEKVIKRADQAMYIAKEKGRNMVVLNNI